MAVFVCSAGGGGGFDFVVLRQNCFFKSELNFLLKGLLILIQKWD